MGQVWKVDRASSSRLHHFVSVISFCVWIPAMWAAVPVMWATPGAAARGQAVKLQPSSLGCMGD